MSWRSCFTSVSYHPEDPKHQQSPEAERAHTIMEIALRGRPQGQGLRISEARGCSKTSLPEGRGTDSLLQKRSISVTMATSSWSAWTGHLAIEALKLKPCRGSAPQGSDEGAWTWWVNARVQSPLFWYIPWLGIGGLGASLGAMVNSRSKLPS